MENAIKKAARFARGQSNLARFFGISPQAVQQWCKSGVCPADRVIGVEHFIGGKVSRYELRPDIYPPTKEKRTDQ